MTTKKEFIEADNLKDDVWNSDSKHCFSIDHKCDYLRETKDAYATGDSPTEYDCTCNDPFLCPAVSAVYVKMEDLKEDEDVTYQALENAAGDIARFSDANNGLALSILVAKTLRIERFKEAKGELL